MANQRWKLMEKDERLYRIIFKEEDLVSLMGELQKLEQSRQYPEIYKDSIDYDLIYAFCYRLIKLRNGR
jgi:hypothetical protein